MTGFYVAIHSEVESYTVEMFHNSLFSDKCYLDKSNFGMNLTLSTCFVKNYTISSFKDWIMSIQFQSPYDINPYGITLFVIIS